MNNASLVAVNEDEVDTYTLLPKVHITAKLFHVHSAYFFEYFDYTQLGTVLL